MGNQWIGNIRPNLHGEEKRCEKMSWILHLARKTFFLGGEEVGVGNNYTAGSEKDQKGIRCNPNKVTHGQFIQAHFDPEEEYDLAPCCLRLRICLHMGWTAGMWTLAGEQWWSIASSTSFRVFLSVVEFLTIEIPSSSLDTFTVRDLVIWLPLVVSFRSLSPFSCLCSSP